ncbi:NAD(P)/FAD-dependent oxidoreductase [Capillimicrobium parvum]|uniref:Dicamba O-demethylase 1, ferredoxin reductase component n=1 Tax=Capillimicrobium parvum TaxID=2884022 RepID=A0A9E6XVF4_9ACTN|nr:FAD-dependent oxidoreductase [Capillimicrobium parvum]UGS34507.1 Dicamba O-demethylase 1, ferredoxin reductase component [Capillimicrobium parvum]
MTSAQTFVIIGAGLAGAKAAEALREEGFDGRVVLLGAEDERPYERPPLSKEYLRGEAQREKIFVHPEGFYVEHDVELRTSAAVRGIDAATREVVLDGDQRLPYDRALLATGAQPHRLKIPGADLDEVYELRTVADCDRLRERLSQGGRLVVIGAGWIGAEVAASARTLGLDVTVIDPAAVPLERVLGTQVGGIYRDIHADHGVRLMLGTGVEAFEGSDRVERVRTTDGRVVDADLVVVGVGVAPRTELARAAGAAVDNGVLVDDRLRTSLPDVFAAGDIANARHPLFERLRVEHWSNALHQGPAAARNMLGLDRPYDRLPYFFSDQYDVGMEYTGYAADWDEIVFRGDPATREFIVFWLAEGRVLAGMNVNVWDVTEPIGALIRSRSVVDVRRLADPDVPLAELVDGVAA